MEVAPTMPRALPVTIATRPSSVASITYLHRYLNVDPLPIARDLDAHPAPLAGIGPRVTRELIRAALASPCDPGDDRDGIGRSKTMNRAVPITDLGIIGGAIVGLSVATGDGSRTAAVSTRSVRHEDRLR
jgi:hypothetical protein